MQIPQNTTIQGTVQGFSLEQYLGAKRDLVNEEELFSAIIAQRLAKGHGSDVAASFQKAVQSKLKMAAENKQRLGVEDASYAALQELVTKKVISKTECETILAHSFDAAQLDDDKSKLWDSIGGKNDPTIATASYESAMASAIKTLAEIDSGKRKPQPAPAAGAAQQGGASSFLFKPISNNSGTASVLIPASVGKEAVSVSLQEASGAVIEQGRFTSFGDTGDMAKYAFRKPGGSYPKDLVVVVTLKSGEVMQIPVADPSRRTEKK